MIFFPAFTYIDGYDAQLDSIKYRIDEAGNNWKLNNYF